MKVGHPYKLNADAWFYVDKRGVEIFTNFGGIRVTKGCLKKILDGIEAVGGGV